MKYKHHCHKEDQIGEPPKFFLTVLHQVSKGSSLQHKSSNLFDKTVISFSYPHANPVESVCSGMTLEVVLVHYF